MKKQVYRCAWFEGDCQRKAWRDGRPKSASLVIDENLSKHFAIISLLPFSNREIVCGSYFGVYGSTCWLYGLKDVILSFLGYELYSLDKVGRLGAENGCSTLTHTHTHRQTLRRSIYRLAEGKAHHARICYVIIIMLNQKFQRLVSIICIQVARKALFLVHSKGCGEMYRITKLNTQQNRFFFLYSQLHRK